MNPELPKPPKGRVEFDFCQMQYGIPRVSARERDGRFEIYASTMQHILFTSDDWESAYQKGREYTDLLKKGQSA